MDTLPALKALGELRNARPVIVIDTREQTPLVFDEDTPTTTGTLETGDYSVAGLEWLVAIERKSIADLTGSLTAGRERFERELCRLRGYRFRRLLVEGTAADVDEHLYRSQITPAAIWGALASYEVRYDLPFVFAGDRQRAAKMVTRWAYYCAREYVVTANEVARGCGLTDRYKAGRRQRIDAADMMKGWDA